jgi:wyosine [tRNA(Phe)-imidazoG37] synthetase (radical SAM superfamily)
VYCQLGRTNSHSIERKEYVPLDQVVRQIQEAIETGPKPDFITLAGSGEPTLFLKLAELIRRIRDITDIPIDIITNGSMLWMDDVFEAVKETDLIVPSLDAGDSDTYQKINRPAESITFEKILMGLNRLAENCPEKVWLEVFLIDGINADPLSVGRIAEIVNPMKFAKVQINTAVRPPAEGYVKPISPEKIRELAMMFTPPAEIIADFPIEKVTETNRTNANSILEMLFRRPCTIEDISAGLNTSHLEILKHLEILLREHKISTRIQNDKQYFVVV